MTQRYSVDYFMDRNNRNYEWLSQPSDRRAGNRRGLHIPSLTMDEANDMYGFPHEDETETEIGFSVILPRDTALEFEHTAARNYFYTRRDEADVIFQCDCADPRKINHHPDYDRPMEVMKLCRSCHAKLHSELRRKEKQMLIATLALKYLYCKARNL
jgi:hypothetical protein